MGMLWALKTISARDGTSKRDKASPLFPRPRLNTSDADRTVPRCVRNVILKQSPPLVEAAARSRRGILRIQGQQNHLVALRSLQLRNRLTGERMPVAHGHKTARIQALIRQFRLQSSGLLLGEAANGRAATDSRIMVLHFACAGSRN